jgi:hypothetical protein
LGGHVVSSQTPLPRSYPTASGWGIQKIIIKWLNMSPKPDKECEERGDIILVFEIIKNSIYWQVNL